MLIGSHISIAGGIDKAPLRGREVGCDVIQVFTKSSNQWKALPLSEKTVDLFQENLSKAGIKTVVAHNCYLINLASPDKELYKKSQDAFLIEMERAEKLKIPYLIFHPGSYKETSIDEGIERIASALKYFIEKTKGYKLILTLETTAGQGSSIGHTFSQIKEIIDAAAYKERLGVCIDTCHIFAAGYDISTMEGYKKTFKEAETTFGIDMIKAFHINDSKKPLGSRVDRHEHIGKGYLGLEPFRFLLNDSRFKNIPMVLETPKGKDMKEDITNLAVLRGLVHRLL